MNSTLQFLSIVPELMTVLKRYSQNENGHGIDASSHSLTVSAQRTFSELGGSTTPIRPSHFLNALHRKHPDFAQLENGALRQQDAEECLSVLVDTFSRTMASEASEPTADLMKSIFEIDLQSSLHCAKTGEKGLVVETVNLLRCPISDGMDHLHEGLKNSMTTEIEKHSPLLGQNSIYKKDSKINKLPRYLTLQLARMDWDKSKNELAKNCQKVDHPLQLDMYDHCSDELKLALETARQVSSKSVALGSSCMDTDQADSSASKKHLTGVYNLVAVITHNGPTTNSGHYVSWIKQTNETWTRLDDHVATSHEEQEILSLCGGADEEHVAYLYLYKAQVT